MRACWWVLAVVATYGAFVAAYKADLVKALLLVLYAAVALFVIKKKWRV